MTKARQQLTRFAAVFAGGTMLSRVLGMVRDMVLLNTIPSGAKEIFFFAFKIPNMLRDMLGEGAVNAAYVPLFSRCLEKEGEASFRRLVRACLSATILLFLVLTVVGIFLVPLLLEPALKLLQPMTNAEPKSEGEIAQIISVLRWIMPYLFFIGTAVFAMGPLFVMKRYGPPSWSPMVLNVALIASCLLLRDFFPDPIWALVAGVWLGGIGQLLVLFWAMKRHAGVLTPSWELGHPGIRQAFILLIPVVFGQATGEVNKLVDALFAIQLNAVTTLYTANRLVQLPLSIFGIAVAVAILPSISAAGGRGDYGEIRKTLLHGLRQSAFLVLPALAVLLIMGEELILLLFEFGNANFTPEDGHRAAQALFYSGMGLLSFTWVKVGIQGFFAIQDTRSPVIVATLSMLLNIVLNMALVGPMGFQGLALATTLSFTANFFGLYVLLSRRYGLLLSRTFLLGVGKVILATIVAGGALVLVRNGFPDGLLPKGTVGEALQLAMLLSVMGGVYGGCCLVLRVEDLALLKKLLRR
ncbi:MAG: murein biosynthesis integral membrane protein MurJ [Candidatus Hydrogenedentes bacterium]|nr:murein biosynthesis integral membrane protein MurJ [Candidatus Hydrogenedentota bacterium]